MRKEIGSNNLLALSLLIFTADFEKIFFTSTRAFYFFLCDVDFKSAIVSAPNSSIKESGLKS